MVLRAALVLGYVICPMMHASGSENDSERREERGVRVLKYLLASCTWYGATDDE